MTARKKKDDAVTKDATPEVAAPVVLAYKGFDQNFRCRGYQYEVGKTFEHDGPVSACNSGFHACESPFDVLGYYGFYQTRFAVVEMGGKISRYGRDTKLAAARITIKAELKLPELIQAGIDWIWEHVDPKKIDTSASAENSSGIDARIGSSGYDARIGSSGNGAQIGSSGYDAQIGSSGDDAQIGSSGDGAQIGSSGYDARIGSSGNGAQIGSSGYDAQIGSSGDDAQIGSSGDGAQIGSSGNGARIGSSGDGAQIGSSGYDARIGSSGYAARIGSSGDDAQIDSTGKNAVIACAGRVAQFRVGSGGCIAVPYHDGTRTRFATLYEGETIQAGVWYALDATGNPVAVEA